MFEAEAGLCPCCFAEKGAKEVLRRCTGKGFGVGELGSVTLPGNRQIACWEVLVKCNDECC